MCVHKALECLCEVSTLCVPTELFDPVVVSRLPIKNLQGSKQKRRETTTNMSSLTDEARLTAECLCKQHHFTATVPSTSLPISATTCHCNSCRRVTGALYSIDAPWPGDFEAIRQSRLHWYDFSANLKILFCGTCSAPLFWESPTRDAHGLETGRTFTVFVGALANNEGAAPMQQALLLEVGCHMFVGDTRDGGASLWMRRMNGEQRPPVPRFAQAKSDNEQQLAWDWPGGTEAATHPGQQQQDEVPVRCHCGGVDLVFLRREAEEDLRALPADELPHFVDPDSRKYVVVSDACNSCRVSFGADFSHQAFVWLRHLSFAARQQQNEAAAPTEDPSRAFPQTFDDLYAAVQEGDDDNNNNNNKDARMGTLAVYGSSEGVKRYFCSRCSACVLYVDEDRPTPVVDLAIGLVRAHEGARAERSFAWRLEARVPHGEDVADGWRGAWLRAVEAGVETYRDERSRVGDGGVHPDVSKGSS